MRNRASLLVCCLAALPLAACAGAGAYTQQSYLAPANAAVAPPAALPVAYTGPTAPAVLVFLPDAGFGADMLESVPPGLWADQNLGVVTPRISDALLEQARDADREFSRLLTYAHAMANAPVWLVGSAPQIQEALERLPAGSGEVSGVVMTSVAGPGGSCSETVTYSTTGGGAPPVVKVSSSGNACGGLSPSVRPPVYQEVPQPPPARRPNAILVRNEHARPLVREIAAAIKQAPNG